MSTTTTTAPPGRRAAIQIDARSEATLDSITAADFLEALGHDALPTLAHVWPEKKKVELHAEPEVSPNLKLGTLIDRINEKRKVELAVSLGAAVYPPFVGAAAGGGLSYGAGAGGTGTPKRFVHPSEVEIPIEKRVPEWPRDPSLVKGGGREPPDLLDILGSRINPAELTVLANQIAALIAPRLEAHYAKSASVGLR